MRSEVQTEVELVAGDGRVRCWVTGRDVAVDQWVTLVDHPLGGRRWRVAKVFGTRHEPLVAGWAVVHLPDAPSSRS